MRAVALLLLLLLLLMVVCACVGRDPRLAPRARSEWWGGLVGRDLRLAPRALLELVVWNAIICVPLFPVAVTIVVRGRGLTSLDVGMCVI